ncbi:hypothetical protein [Peribacillus simplex]|uniref:hypothetical protein n=1 Tax=Peribacillus simplex TaxID=1478 RepID=UPI0036DF2727
MKKKPNKKEQQESATQEAIEGKDSKEKKGKKGPKDGTASTESVQTQELSEPKGHKAPHEGGESAGTGKVKHSKGAKGKKDRKMVQPSFRNLKAIKILMKEKNQREPVRSNMAKAPRGKKGRKKDRIKKGTIGYKHLSLFSFIYYPAPDYTFLLSNNPF